MDGGQKVYMLDDGGSKKPLSGGYWTVQSLRRTENHGGC
jgi:hypothetical protein